MRNLRWVLSQYVSPAVAGDTRREIALTGLRSDLARLRSENGYYFAICVVVFLAIFVGEAGALILYGQAPVVAAGAVLGSGASLVGIGLILTRLWREKVAVDLLLTLVTALDEEAVRSLVDILARKLR